MCVCASWISFSIPLEEALDEARVHYINVRGWKEGLPTDVRALLKNQKRNQAIYVCLKDLSFLEGRFESGGRVSAPDW